jgi:hypothetical protein
VASKNNTTGDRPGTGIAETNPARSNVSNPREAENRERPNSGQSSSASSNSADRFQPAKSRQTAPNWSDFPGSRRPGARSSKGSARTR